MPTETEFLMARDAFRAAAETVRAPVGPMVHATGPTVLVGGVLTRDTEECLDGAAAHVRTIADRCEGLADECDWRARVCAAAYAAQLAYERTYHSYEDSHRHWAADRDAARDRGEPFTRDEPDPPHRPPPPPPWVEWR